MRSRAWMDWENIELNSLLEPSVPLWLRNQVKRQAISIIDCLASVGTKLRRLANHALQSSCTQERRKSASYSSRRPGPKLG